MLVVTDKRARGIGRKRGLAGARQAEEHGGITLGADVGRAVHRHHALGGQQVVEDAEDRLLHLARIGGAADQDQLLGEVHRDHGLAAATVTLGIGAEAGQVDDRVFRREAFEFIGSRTHQQGAHEQVVPREFVDDTHLDALLRLRAAEQVRHIERVLLGHGLEEVLLQRSKVFRRHGDVGLAPPDGILRLGILDDELVLGRTASVLAGGDDERAVNTQYAFSIAYCVLDERCRAQVRENFRAGFNALFGKRVVQGSGQCHLLHFQTPTDGVVWRPDIFSQDSGPRLCAAPFSFKSPRK